MAMMSAQNLDLALRRGRALEPPERRILEALCAAGDQFVTFSTLQSVSRVRNGHFYYRAWARCCSASTRLRLPRLQEQEQGQGLPRLRRPAPGRGGRVVPSACRARCARWWPNGWRTRPRGRRSRSCKLLRPAPPRALRRQPEPLSVCQRIAQRGGGRPDLRGRRR